MHYEFPRRLRYSPLNGMIVNWGFNGRAFNDCGLPDPQPCEDPEHYHHELCCPLPIKEAIDTMGWEPWLPEIIVGIEDPDEEIAASYVREAAIEFAKKTRVLQRQILIPLQPDVDTYPVEPYDGEQIIGVIGAGVNDRPACACGPTQGYVPDGVNFTLDVARNEIHVDNCCVYDCCKPCNILRLLVWSAPKESACDHDVFLYERFRSDIAAGARWRYASQVHFRDAALMRSLNALPDFQVRMALAKGKALSKPSHTRKTSDSGMWSFGRRGCF